MLTQSCTIVAEPHPSRRVQLISFFIAVADECLVMCNFSTMMAIWRGLEADCVRRLVLANSEAMQVVKLVVNIVVKLVVKTGK